MSQVAKHVADDIRCASRSTANVLISGGDTGTRAAIARLIHARRGRAGALVESDPGVPVSAAPSDTTIFIREIGDLSSSMQSRLKDLIERELALNLIAATGYNLLDRVAARTFDEDLFYRLNIIHIVIDRQETWTHLAATMAAQES